MAKINRIKKSKKRILQQKKDMLEHYLSKGLSVKDACLLAEVSKQQLSELRSNIDFEEFYQRCLAEYKMEHLENVRTAGKNGNWQASTFILERQFSEEFAKKDIVKHEYEVKFMTFQKIILDIINQADPKLKYEIVKKLREMDQQDIKLVEDKSNIVDAEIVE